MFKNINKRLKEIDLNIKKSENINNENILLKRYLNLDKLNRELVEMFIKKICVYDENTIKITYNFKQN